MRLALELRARIDGECGMHDISDAHIEVHTLPGLVAQRGPSRLVTLYLKGRMESVDSLWVYART